MSLLRLRDERGGETLWRAFLRGRDGGRSDGFVGLALSTKDGGWFVRFRVDVDMTNINLQVDRNSFCFFNLQMSDVTDFGTSAQIFSRR